MSWISKLTQAFTPPAAAPARTAPPPPPPAPPAAVPPKAHVPLFQQSRFESTRRPQLDLSGGAPPPPPATPAKPATAAAAQGPASSLASEVLNDGSSNCLEQAYESARPGDQVLLYADADDPVGHAVVQRPNGAVVDPSEPGKTYPNRAAWEAAHTGYRQPVAIPQAHLSQVFAAKPGPQRDAALRELGLTSIANRQVADGVTPERQAVLRDAATRVGTDADMLDQIFGGTQPPGPLTVEEQDFLIQQSIEHSLSSGDAGEMLAYAGSNAAGYPHLAEALGHAFDTGAVTPETLARLLGPEGLGRYGNFLEFSQLVAASGSDALQGEVATRLWNQAAGDASLQAAALMAVGSSGPATQRLIDTAGTDALQQTLLTLSEVSGQTVPNNVYATAAGSFMSGLAELPRSEGNDRLAATIFLSTPLGVVEGNDTMRAGLAHYMAAVRNPGDAAAQQADARQWNTLLDNPYAQQLLFNPELPVEARQGNLLFFLQRPNFDPEMLNTYQGNLGSISSAEAQMALAGMDPASVSGLAELPPVPAELAGQFPEIANLPRPVNAETLRDAIPSPISPTMAADYLDALADSVARTGDTNMATYTGGDHAMAALFQLFAGNPVSQAHLDDFSAVGVAGLRDLATQLRTTNDPALAAQALTLGGIQHEAYFDNLTPFAESVIAQRDQVLGNMTTVRQFAQTAAKTGVSALAMAAGGPAASAAANAALGSVFAALDASLEGRQLALPNLIGGAVVDFGIGALSPVLGERAKNALGPILGRLTQGLFDAAGGQVAEFGRDPQLLEELWSDPAKRDDVARALILGTLAGSVPWDNLLDKLSPGLQRELFTYLGVPETARGSGTIADEVLKSSALEASSIWLDAALQSGLRSGALTPEQAVQQMQETGIDFFGDGTASADPATTAAMLRLLMSSP